ncbi:ribosomal protein L7/L12 [Emergomyces africanus]|uniref:Ribosomal protein L7/L12 n=1 Tax=Emergomyces africanus TaxID=1955775 RepID=A0A1B7NTJ6_9EURO|nr:ribosomal protein L7/L12 [Emergomyces africanus]
MSIPSQTAARCCRNALRQSPSYRLPSTTTYFSQCKRITPAAVGARRWQSTEAPAAAPTNPKITQIVDQITGPAAGGAAPAAAVEEEDAAPAAQEKTLFNLKLESFEAASKPKVIKEIKSLLSLSLVDSKKFVEGAPKVMKESVPKEEAEKIVKAMKDLGAKVVME